MRSSTVPARVSQSRSRYPLRWLRRSALRSPGAALQRPSVSSCISRSAAKPIISRRNDASEPFSKSARRAILSSVIGVVLGFRLFLDNSTLPRIIAMATDWPAYARLSAVAAAGQSVASYTTNGDTTPASGRYLSFVERDELAILHAQSGGVREIARKMGRAASTISRELRRNVATRSGGFDYRAVTAQWHAERVARRPKLAKLS